MSKRFLISRLSALGDVVCTLPAAVALSRSFPGAEIVWAVDPRFAGIVECCRSVTKVVRTKPKFSPGSWRVDEGRFDAAFDLQGLLKSGIVVGCSKAEVKLGYHWQREGSGLFSARVLPDPTSFHVVDQYVDVVRAAGATADRAEFDLSPLPEDLDVVQEMLTDAGVDIESMAVLNAGAGWASKRWPGAHFAALAREMKRAGYACVFIGGKADSDKEAFAEVIKNDAAGVVDFLGKTSVRELVALISLAKVHVGGDTGSTHIAAALGRPAIGLYSITNPRRSCPYGQFDNCLYNPDGLERILPADVTALLDGAVA